MNRLALILLLGSSLVMANQVEYTDGDARYADDADIVEYADDEVATNRADSLEMDENTAVRSVIDNTDITRWNYTEDDIADAQAKMQRRAEREAEYQKSITRKRSGGFLVGQRQSYKKSKMCLKIRLLDKCCAVELGK